MRPDTEEKILALCNQAKAKGWKFMSIQEAELEDAPGCGCALMACASESDEEGAYWGDVGRELGLSYVCTYGSGFDRAARGEAPDGPSPEHLMGYRHGRHFVHGDPL